LFARLIGGKSAILTAVVLGLGGRAATTSRGKGIASFIKSGESQAKIILKICNSNDALGGKRGYNADHYGKSIIIERTINASGASSYKLKSAAGKLVADRKEQLDSMIRYFNIQVDNPICVLNQEVSRNFLNTKNSRDKYTFFMKATLLEDVKSDYAAAETHRTISQKILDQKKAVIPDTTRDLKELERKVKMFNDLENHKERFARLNGEALWALVNEQKAAFEDVRAQVVVFSKRVETQSRKVDEAKAAIAQLDSDKTDTMARMNSLLEDVNQTNDALEELKTQVNDIKEKIRTKERDERSVTTERNVATNDIKNIEKKIKGYEQQFRYCLN
jgi:chromosome segregation ATPase